MISLDEQMYKEKYLKYKSKYIKLKEYHGGAKKGFKRIISSNKSAFIFAEESHMNTFFKIKGYSNFNIIKKHFNKRGYIIYSDTPSKIMLIDSSTSMSGIVGYVKEKGDNVKTGLNSFASTTTDSLDKTVSTVFGDNLVIDDINSISGNIRNTIKNINTVTEKFKIINMNNDNVTKIVNDIIDVENSNILKIDELKTLLFDDRKKRTPRFYQNPKETSSDSSKTQTNFIKLEDINISNDLFIKKEQERNSEINNIINIIKVQNNLQSEFSCIFIQFSNKLTNDVDITKINTSAAPATTTDKAPAITTAQAQAPAITTAQAQAPAITTDKAPEQAT